MLTFASSGRAYVSSQNVNMLRNAKAKKDQEKREKEKKDVKLKIIQF